MLLQRKFKKLASSTAAPAKKPNLANRHTARFLTGWLLVGLLVLLAGVQPVAAQTPIPTVTTDKEDYGPTEIPQIFGSNFAPGTELDLIVLTPKELQKGKNLKKKSKKDGWYTLTSEADGSFFQEYTPVRELVIGGLYEVRVYNTPWNGKLNKEPLAMTTFTDGAPDIELWHNLPTEKWSGGQTVQQANSGYGEGDSIPARYTQEPGGSAPHFQEGETHTIRLKWDATADPDDFRNFIDYLTTYDATEFTVIGHAFDGLTCDTTSVAIPNDPTLPPLIQQPGTFLLCNIDSSSITFTTGPYVLEAPSGGKVVKYLDITFDVADNGVDPPDENVDVGIAFGVHLASEADWELLGSGAGTFPGASPQVSINVDSDSSDSSININPSAVLVRPRILIVKDDTADSNTLFDFTGELGDFTLQDPSDNTETFLGLSSGEFTVTEESEGGFALTGITCEGEVIGGSSFPPTFTVNGNSVDITVDFDQQVTCTFTNTAAPTMTVEKTSATTSLSSPTTVTYDYLVTNTGLVALTGISLSDDNDNNDMVCGTDTLAPAETTTCTATHTFTQAELDANGSPTPGSGVLFNTVTASSDQGAGATDDLIIDITLAPGISIIKNGDFNDENEDSFAQVGETITYTFDVTNTGNVTLTNVTVTDPLFTVNGGPTTLEVGETDSTTFTGTYIITQADIDVGLRDNTATASGTDPDGTVVENTDFLELVMPSQGPALAILKTASPTTYSAVGDVISYSYLVTNVGAVTLFQPFTIDDDIATDESCPETPASLARVSRSPVPPATPSPRTTWIPAQSPTWPLLRARVRA